MYVYGAIHFSVMHKLVFDFYIFLLFCLYTSYSVYIFLILFYLLFLFVLIISLFISTREWSIYNKPKYVKKNLTDTCRISFLELYVFTWQQI